MDYPPVYRMRLRMVLLTMRSVNEIYLRVYVKEEKDHGED